MSERGVTCQRVVGWTIAKRESELSMRLLNFEETTFGKTDLGPNLDRPIITIMPSDQRPSTPPTGATTPQSLPIQSTPHSQGSSSHFSYQSQNHQSDYKPYLTEDIKHRYTVTFDEFLNDILHLASDWIEQNTSRISDIVHPQRFGNMVSKYREPVTCKTFRYPPFIIFANHVIN